MAGRYFQYTRLNEPAVTAYQQPTELMMQAGLAAAQQVQQTQAAEDNMNNMLMEVVNNAESEFRPAVVDKLQPVNDQIQKYSNIFNQGDYQSYRRQTPQALRQIGVNLKNDMMSTEKDSLGRILTGNAQLKQFLKSFDEKDVDPSVRNVMLQSRSSGKLKGMINDYIKGDSDSLNLPAAPKFFDKGKELREILKARGLDERQIQAVVASDMQGYLKTQTTSEKFIPPDDLKAIIDGVWNDPRNQAVESFHRIIGSDYNPVGQDAFGNPLYESNAQTVSQGMNEFATTKGFDNFQAAQESIGNQIKTKYEPKLKAAKTRAEMEKVQQAAATELQELLQPYATKAKELAMTSTPGGSVTAAEQRYRDFTRFGSAMSATSQTVKADYKQDWMRKTAIDQANRVALEGVKRSAKIVDELNKNVLSGNIQVDDNGNIHRQVPVTDENGNMIMNEAGTEYQFRQAIVGNVNDLISGRKPVLSTSSVQQTQQQAPPITGNIGTNSVTGNQQDTTKSNGTPAATSLQQVVTSTSSTTPSGQPLGYHRWNFNTDNFINYQQTIPALIAKTEAIQAQLANPGLSKEAKATLQIQLDANNNILNQQQAFRNNIIDFDINKNGKQELTDYANAANERISNELGRIVSRNSRPDDRGNMPADFNTILQAQQFEGFSADDIATIAKHGQSITDIQSLYNLLGREIPANLRSGGQFTLERGTVRSLNRGIENEIVAVAKQIYENPMALIPAKSDMLSARTASKIWQGAGNAFWAITGQQDKQLPIEDINPAIPFSNGAKQYYQSQSEQGGLILDKQSMDLLGDYLAKVPVTMKNQYNVDIYGNGSNKTNEFLSKSNQSLVSMLQSGTGITLLTDPNNSDNLIAVMNFAPGQEIKTKILNNKNKISETTSKDGQLVYIEIPKQIIDMIPAISKIQSTDQSAINFAQRVTVPEYGQLFDAINFAPSGNSYTDIIYSRDGSRYEVTTNKHNDKSYTATVNEILSDGTRKPVLNPKTLNNGEIDEFAGYSVAQLAQNIFKTIFQ
jgi:hypothetical protein